MKKYIKTNGAFNTVRVETYYSKGGYNYFTYKDEPRAFYISVTPLNRTVKNGYITEEYSAFTGVKRIILNVTRYSKKAEQMAEQMAERIQQELIDYVLNKNGLTVEDVEND